MLQSGESPVVAGSTQWGTRHIAAVESNAGFDECRLTGAGAYSPYRPRAVINESRVVAV